MRELIRHILKEQSNKLKLLKVIQNEGIFSAAELVGGLNNLKRVFKDNKAIIDRIESLKGKVTFGYDGIDFPFNFDIIGMKANKWNTNFWPIVNVTYDNSELTEEEDNLVKRFIIEGQDSPYNVSFIITLDKNYEKIRFNTPNYITIKEINGENADQIDFPIVPFTDPLDEMLRLRSKLYKKTSLYESVEDTQKNVINFLMRRYEVEDKDLGWDEDNLPMRLVKFDVNGQTYVITSFDTKRKQINEILYMLIENNIIERPFENFNENDPYRQKIVRTIKMFLNKVM